MEKNHFLELEIERRKGLFFYQHKYVRNLLLEFGMRDCKPILTPIEINSKLCLDEGKDLKNEAMYQHLVGSLIYSTLTRFDITYIVGSHFTKKSKKPHLKSSATNLEVRKRSS